MIYEVPKEMFFIDAVKHLKDVLKQTGSSYRQILHKGIYVIVSQDSNVDDICVIYDLKKRIKQLETSK